MVTKASYNHRISEKEFMSMRPEILNSWPTGKRVNLNEAVDFIESLLPDKSFTTALTKAIESNTTLIQPRAGVPQVEKLIELLNILLVEGQADVLPVTIDSYTRLNRYKEAEKGLEKSLSTGEALLNGFPAVNYGVDSCRKVINEINAPLQIRHGTPDSRLLAEITFAGGFTSFEGGAITYTIPYSKNIELRKTIRHWQYVDRLVGWYGERGIIINRESFGPLTGTLIPPCVSIAIGILELLLAAEQGVLDFTLGYCQGGNVVQDIAAIRVLKKMAQHYLEQYSFNGIRISTVFHQWMGAFPENTGSALAVITLGGIVATSSGANKIITKTPDEAAGVPTADANVLGLRATRQAINLVKGQNFCDEKMLFFEEELLTREVDQILNGVFRLVEGNLDDCIVTAFSSGILDVPFSPSLQAKGNILPVRDSMGAIRILEFGNLPLSDDIKAFHYQQIMKRAKNEKRAPGYEMVVEDIMGVARGKTLAVN